MQMNTQHRILLEKSIFYFIWSYPNTIFSEFDRKMIVLTTDY